MAFRPRIALLLISVGTLTAISTYRAATQSLTHDEALTYSRYLVQPWEVAFGSYTANHHLLFTYLSKLSVGLFGASEWSLRLPSILGAAVYGGCIALLCLRLAATRWLAIAALASLLLNPFVLDFLAAARGYGLGLGLLVAAITVASRRLESPAPRRRSLVACGALLGLALSASLTLLPAVVGVTVGLVALEVSRPAGAGGGGARRPQRLLAALSGIGIPASLVLGGLVAAPLRHLEAGRLFFGSTSPKAAIESLLESSFFHSTRILSSAQAEVVSWCAIGVLALLVLMACWALPVALRDWVANPGDPEAGDARASRCLLLVTFTVAAATSLGLSLAFDLSYPKGRTGLFFIPLFTLALVATVSGRPGGVRSLRPLAALLLTAASLVFVVDFDPGFFRTWRQDAGIKRLVEQATERPAKASDAPLRVAALDWRNQPALAYYQQRAGPGVLAPIVRGWTVGDFSYDLYVVPAVLDRKLVDEYLETLFTDPVSGVALARNR